MNTKISLSVTARQIFTGIASHVEQLITMVTQKIVSIRNLF